MKQKYKPEEMPEVIYRHIIKHYDTVVNCANETGINARSLYNVTNGVQKPTKEILALIGYEFHAEYRKVR